MCFCSSFYKNLNPNLPIDPLLEKQHTSVWLDSSLDMFAEQVSTHKQLKSDTNSINGAPAALFQLVFSRKSASEQLTRHIHQRRTRQNSCAPSLTSDPVCIFAANSIRTPVRCAPTGTQWEDVIRPLAQIEKERKKNTTFLMSFTHRSEIPLIILLMPLCPFLQAQKFLFMLPAGNISDERLRLLSSPV